MSASTVDLGATFWVVITKAKIMALSVGEISCGRLDKPRRARDWRIRATAMLMLVGLAWLGGFANPAKADDDLPGRVGRVADFAGQLYLVPEDPATEWSAIGVNYPVTSGDNLWIAGEGRAEVDYGAGQFRLAGDTSLNVARLDDRTVSLFVAQGRVILRVRVLEPGDVARIDTPNAQLQLLRPGLYRIDVGDDRTRTMLVVREGEANVLLPSAVQQVLPGQTAEIRGVDAAWSDVRNGYWTDGFDAWSGDRDLRYERSQSAAYVSREMVGYADLDDYGTWERYPEYGAVWFPTAVPSGWAPYRDGSWTFVGGWGWTWVDSAPWGYAPFHYGRWANIRGRWGWCPGGYVARPTWAPALVAWYGGPGWSVSASAGGPVYGWVPLGWGEAYLPAWRNCSNRCWTQYNRPYAVTLRERPSAPPGRHVNYTVPGGFTAVPGAAFTGGRHVMQNAVTIPSNAAATARVVEAPIMRPAPGRIPGIRPGTGGVPPPASTFYPTGRPALPIPMQSRGTPDAAPSPGTRGPAPADTGTPSPASPRIAAPPRRGSPATIPGQGALPDASRSASPASTVPVAPIRPAPDSAIGGSPPPGSQAPARTPASQAGTGSGTRAPRPGRPEATAPSSQGIALPPSMRAQPGASPSSAPPHAGTPAPAQPQGAGQSNVLAPRPSPVPHAPPGAATGANAAPANPTVPQHPRGEPPPRPEPQGPGVPR